jgi:hypothetical protein
VNSIVGSPRTTQHSAISATPRAQAFVLLRTCLNIRPVGAPGLQYEVEPAVSREPRVPTRRFFSVLKQGLSSDIRLNLTHLPALAEA